MSIVPTSRLTVYGWLSKLWSLSGPLDTVPYYTKEPKRNHSSDHHPSNCSGLFGAPGHTRFTIPATRLLGSNESLGGGGVRRFEPTKS